MAAMPHRVPSHSLTSSCCSARRRRFRSQSAIISCSRSPHISPAARALISTAGLSGCADPERNRLGDPRPGRAGPARVTPQEADLQVNEFDSREALRRERQEARAAARAFVRACEDADLRAFYFAVDALNDSVDGWRLACKAVARLDGIKPRIRRAFLMVWTKTKMLPLTIGDDRVTRDAIRVLLPPYTGKRHVRLFRGTIFREHRRRAYGFSWSKDRATAERFAERHAQVAAEGGQFSETIEPGGHIARNVSPASRYHLRAANDREGIHC